MVLLLVSLPNPNQKLYFNFILFFKNFGLRSPPPPWNCYQPSTNGVGRCILYHQTAWNKNHWYLHEARWLPDQHAVLDHMPSLKHNIFIHQSNNKKRIKGTEEQNKLWPSIVRLKKHAHQFSMLNTKIHFQ